MYKEASDFRLRMADFRFDNPVKSQNTIEFVIPVKNGTQPLR